VGTRRRWVVGVMAAPALVAFALWSNGLLGVGPLGEQLGFRTTWIDPIGYTTAKDAPTTLTVLFPWPENGFCAGQFTVQVHETPTSVLVDQVKSSAPKRICPDIGGGGRLPVAATLSQPLGTRSVVRASDQKLLRYVPDTRDP